MALFESTKNGDAHFYLDSSGNEISRQEFLEENVSWYGTMFYLGGGIEPLRVAVLTDDARGFHQPDYDSALEIVREWARNTGREDWVGEDDDYKKAVAEGKDVEPEFEMIIQSIPLEALVLAGFPYQNIPIEASEKDGEWISTYQVDGETFIVGEHCKSKREAVISAMSAVNDYLRVKEEEEYSSSEGYEDF